MVPLYHKYGIVLDFVTMLLSVKTQGDNLDEILCIRYSYTWFARLRMR